MIEPEQPRILLDSILSLSAHPESAKLIGELGQQFADENLAARHALHELLVTLASPMTGLQHEQPSKIC